MKVNGTHYNIMLFEMFYGIYENPASVGIWQLQICSGTSDLTTQQLLGKRHYYHTPYHYFWMVDEHYFLTR